MGWTRGPVACVAALKLSIAVNAIGPDEAAHAQNGGTLVRIRDTDGVVFDRLRTQPRFQRLIGDIGLALPSPAASPQNDR